MKVLVVEDDPNLRSHWSVCLERAGHEAIEAATEAAALAFLQANSVDLVILDLCINGRNALGVATLATYRNAACKVIVVSGAAVFSEKTLFAMSPAVAATLRKPVDIEDLMDVCALVANNRRRLPEREIATSTVEFRS